MSLERVGDSSRVITKEDIRKELSAKEFSVSHRNRFWIFSTFILLILIVLSFIYIEDFFNKNNLMSADNAGKALLNFVEKNPKISGLVTLAGSEREGQLYKVTLRYNNQDVPVYVTLDGKYVAVSLVPITEAGGYSLNGTNKATNVSIGNGAVMGLDNASLTVIEFCDFQDPFCRTFWTEVYPDFKKEYIDSGKVKFVYRNYFDNANSISKFTAKAAACVKYSWGDKGFWRFYDKLVSEQNNLSQDSVGSVKGSVQYSEADVKRWALESGYLIESCYRTNLTSENIEEDLEEGKRLNIQGMPTFFIDGERFVGVVPYSQFKKIIERHLSE